MKLTRQHSVIAASRTAKVALVACARDVQIGQASVGAYWQFGFGYFSQEPGCR